MSRSNQAGLVVTTPTYCLSQQLRSITGMHKSFSMLGSTKSTSSMEPTSSALAQCALSQTSDGELNRLLINGSVDFPFTLLSPRNGHISPGETERLGFNLYFETDGGVPEVVSLIVNGVEMCR